MSYLDGAPDFLVTPEQWGSALAYRYDPANGRPTITPANKLMIHHSASNTPGPGGEAAFSQQLEAYGESRDGAACEYNYFVYPSGVLHGGFGDTRGCHSSQTDPSTGSAYNSSSIGICFVGYFHPPNNDYPTNEAIATFQAWLSWMIDSGRLTGDVLIHMSGGGSPGWYGHRDAWSTACPGEILYPMLPDIVRVGSAPAPSPTPPSQPAGGKDVAIVVVNVTDTWAGFLANATWAPNWNGYVVSDMIWITGEEKANYLAGGLEEVSLTLEQVRGTVLVGPLPQGDQAYPSWSSANFKAHVS